MKSSTTPGRNRTGLAVSPLAQQMLDVPEMTRPSSSGLPADALAPRAEYAREAEPHGTVPPPASLKEAVSTAGKALKGEKATVFLDKLGERLAFERTGTRLYDGILLKFDIFGGWAGGPNRTELERIRDEERRHFLLIQEAIASLGGDPTAVTPSANVHAVVSSGIPKIIEDPRTNLIESLEAISVAELADNECWSTLVALARAGGHDELGRRFEEARVTEERHLNSVRTWMASALAISSAIGPKRESIRSELESARRPSVHRSTTSRITAPSQAVAKETRRRGSSTRRKTPARGKSARRKKR